MGDSHPNHSSNDITNQKKFYQTKTFKVCFQISLTFIIFIAEALTGYLTNCLALLSDSFHTLSDVISLSIGLFAIRTTHKTAGKYSYKTFGYSRAEVLGGIIQAVFLYALCFNIYITAIKRFFSPEDLTDVPLILMVGFIGLVINLIGLFLFAETGEHGHSHDFSPKSKDIESQKDKETTEFLDPNESLFSIAHYTSKNPEEIEKNNRQEGNLNTRGIFLHILGDTLGSVAVMISAGLLWYYDNNTEDNKWLKYVDPSLTFLIATIIAISTYPLLMSSMKILMEHAPEDINLEEFQTKIQKKVTAIGFKNCRVDLDANDVSEMEETELNNNNKKSKSKNGQNTTNLTSFKTDKMLIHDLHIWQLSSTERAATIHVLISRCQNEDDSALLEKYLKIVKFLKIEFQNKNINRLTIQPEFVNLPEIIKVRCDTGACADCGNEGDDCNGGNTITTSLANNTSNDHPVVTKQKSNPPIDIEDLGKAINSNPKKFGYRHKSGQSHKSITDGVNKDFFP